MKNKIKLGLLITGLLTATYFVGAQDYIIKTNIAKAELTKGVIEKNNEIVVCKVNVDKIKAYYEWCKTGDTLSLNSFFTGWSSNQLSKYNEVYAMYYYESKSLSEIKSKLESESNEYENITMADIYISNKRPIISDNTNKSVNMALAK